MMNVQDMGLIALVHDQNTPNLQLFLKRIIKYAIYNHLNVISQKEIIHTLKQVHYSIKFSDDIDVHLFCCLIFNVRKLICIKKDNWIF